MPAESEKNVQNLQKTRFTWGMRFAIATSGTALCWWWGFYCLNHVTLPAISTPLQRIIQTFPFLLIQLIALAFTVWAIVLFFDGLRRSGKVGTAIGVILGLVFVAHVSHSLLSNWFKRANGNFLHWLFWIGPVVAILLYPLPIMRMKRKAMRLAMEGDYEGALRISRRWLRTNVYGRPFRGWILLQAGRYTEALELLKEGAFNEKGKPLLTNTNLYFYCVTLMNLKRYPEAQELLEVAIRVPQKGGHYQFSLAECLLSQNKDLNRAQELIAQAQSNLQRPNSPKDPVFLVQCKALQAWVFASSGDRKSSESILEEAFRETAAFGNDDLAGLLELKGNALEALGDQARAREAFEMALKIFPHGSIAISAARKLLELDVQAR